MAHRILQIDPNAADLEPLLVGWTFSWVSPSGPAVVPIHRTCAFIGRAVWRSRVVEFIFLKEGGHFLVEGVGHFPPFFVKLGGLSTNQIALIKHYSGLGILSSGGRWPHCLVSCRNWILHLLVFLVNLVFWVKPLRQEGAVTRPRLGGDIFDSLSQIRRKR